MVMMMVTGPCSCENKTHVLHHPTGDKLKLDLEVSDSVTSVKWSFGNDVICELTNGSSSLTCNGDYENRAELNTTTAILTLKGLTSKDSGVYSVQVNGEVQLYTTYTLTVVEPVSRPTVLASPDCNANSTTCILTCDVSNPHTVTFYWKLDNLQWMEGKHNIQLENDAEIRAVQTFTCRVWNIASNLESDPLPNPFHVQQTAEEDSSSSTFMSLVICLGADVCRPVFVSQKA